MATVFHMIGGTPDRVAPFSHAVEADGWVSQTWSRCACSFGISTITTRG